MRNQLNQMTGSKNQKEARLKDLYKQLDTTMHLNLRDNLSQIKADTTIANESKMTPED